MVGVPLKAKRGFSEWFGLLLAFITLLVIPDWVRGVITMVREDHWTWIFIPVMICIGYGWNSYLVKRWWNPDAYKFKW